MHHKNVLFYIGDYIKDYSLKLKSPFHILEVTSLYLLLSELYKGQVACLMLTKIENNATYDNE